MAVGSRRKNCPAFGQDYLALKVTNHAGLGIHHGDYIILCHS
jgi:hypothetical protein